MDVSSSISNRNCNKPQPIGLFQRSVWSRCPIFSNGFRIWQAWEENCEVMSRGFVGFRKVFFEIQVCREAAMTMDTQAGDGAIAKLITVAEPFIEKA